MSLVVSDDGIYYQLEAARVQYQSDTLSIRLFKNNYTPDKSMTLGSFTEADFSGYLAIILGSWQGTVVTAHVAKTVATYVQLFINDTGAVGNDIYGYYVTDVANTKVYWAERDPTAPVDMNTIGKTYLLVLSDTNESKFG